MESVSVNKADTMHTGILSEPFCYSMFFKGRTGANIGEYICLIEIGEVKYRQFDAA